MRKIFLLVALVTSLMLGVSGCGEDRKKVEFKVVHVEAVFIHEVGKYSIGATPANTTEIDVTEVPNGGNDHWYIPYGVKGRLFKDVPVCQNMWAMYRGYANPNLQQRKTIEIYSIEIHIHSLRDLQCAGWNHGKSGSGQTNVIEAE